MVELLRLEPKIAVRWMVSAIQSSLPWQAGRFPTTVSIEVTNHCNMTCSTCPQPSLKEKGYLELGLFDKIVDQCANLPRVTSVVFTGFGEPLLHPDLIEMSRAVKDKGIPLVRGYTNCVLLDEKMGEEIILESGFDEITLSLNAPSREIYERIKQSHRYRLVTDNIEHFLLKRKGLKARTPFVNIQLLTLTDVLLSIDSFVHKWAPLLIFGDCISLKASHSFAGQVNDAGVGTLVDNKKRKPCGQLWNYLHVSWNGDVTPCCVDPFKKLKIGNVHDSSLHRLWESPMLRQMRQVHLRGDYQALPLCGACETWRYFPQGFRRQSSSLD